MKNLNYGQKISTAYATRQKRWQLMAALYVFLLFVTMNASPLNGKSAVVFQSDFGVTDSYASIMRGVAHSVDTDLQIFDIRHNITQFDTREAARSLLENALVWPSGTVFVSVVDPGVGTVRRSVVLKTKSGHYFVSPDNGSLDMVAQELGITAVREIDESVNRRKGTGEAHTFHGRDVYSFTGARLASGVITYEQVGPLLEPKVVQLEKITEATISEGVISGTLTSVDSFGNVGTNISTETFEKLGLVRLEDHADITVKHNGEILYSENLPYVKTFGDVSKGEPLLYSNSNYYMELSINLGNFSQRYGIESGSGWTIEIRKAK